MEVGFHDVCENYLNVVVVRKRFLKDRLQGGVYLHRNDLFAPLRKLLCEDAHSGAYLKRADSRLCAAKLRYFRADRRIYQEVLTEGFCERKTVPFEKVLYYSDICKLHQ